MHSRFSFDRYIGIDYSGAQTSSANLKGLRVYMADRVSPPVEVTPPVTSRKYWSRRGIAEWLVERLSEDRATLVGIDHGFSFPLRYFQKHNLPLNWSAFLVDFECHWPVGDHIYVDFVRDGVCGNGSARTGRSTWRRITEVRSGRAKSVFHFDVPGSVAKSTHSGLPWLRYIQQRTVDRVHFWPFDGWQIPPGRSVVAEAYPALWSRTFPQEARDEHQHDAFSIAAWLRLSDANGSLCGFLDPDLKGGERKIAEIEGWILGVV